MGNREHDKIIVRNSQGRVIRTWQAGPFSSLKQAGRVITKESLWSGTETFRVSDDQSIETHSAPIWLQALVVIILLATLCACWGYLMSL